MKRRDRSLAPLRPLGTDWTSRPRLAERTTRPRLAFFDRIKFLLVLAVVFALSVWTAMGDNPLISFNDALRDAGVLIDGDGLKPSSHAKRVAFDGWISIEDGVEGMDQLKRSVTFLRNKMQLYWE